MYVVSVYDKVHCCQYQSDFKETIGLILRFSCQGVQEICVFPNAGVILTQTQSLLFIYCSGEADLNIIL